MKIKDIIKLRFYPELKDLNIDDAILEQIISNKNFKTQYKTSIKPFLKYLQEYEEFDHGNEVSLNDDIIKQHLKATFELSVNNNSSKYISFIKENYFENMLIPNFNILNDPNFEKLYSVIERDIFNENIIEIINSGNSERLLKFINIKEGTELKDINLSFFEDKVWDIIIKNPSIGDSSLLKFFHSRMNAVVDLVNMDLLDGVIYTYERIPESHNFIEEQLGKRKEGCISSKQFSMSFIEKIGDDALNKLYYRGVFSNENEFKKVFEIASFDNYELIKDIINYDTHQFEFRNIKVEDMQKSLLEANINYYNKQEVFLNKYFGIERNDIRYIKIFLSTINKVTNFPDEFKETYGNILQLLNQILISSDEELVNISKTMDLNQKDKYKKLIYACENDGNDILKSQFVSDLKIKKQQILNMSEHKQIKTNDGANIDVYELSGQPFTMLVHAITDNKMSINNSLVSQLVNNPQMWDKIDGANNHISTSLISDKYMAVYGVPNNNSTIMFGFDDFPCDTLKFTEVSDVGIDRNASTNINYNMRNRVFVSNVNTITTVDDLIEKTIEANTKGENAVKQWNEIGLSRIDERTGIRIKPNYVVCMDFITENSIKAAQEFNIPIYLIKRQYYQELSSMRVVDNELKTTQENEEEHLKR